MNIDNVVLFWTYYRDIHGNIATDKDWRDINQAHVLYLWCMMLD